MELDRDLVDVGDPPRITEQTLHVALAIPEGDARARIARGDVGGTPAGGRS